MTKLEQAFISVSCPLCKATAGKRCTMPNGHPYYRREDGRNVHAFHQMRQKRAHVIYQLHATDHAVDEHELRKLKQHPRVLDAATTEGGGKLIHVAFQTPKLGA